MKFGVLGPLQVVDGGRAMDLGGPMQRAVLASLRKRTTACPT
jgi:hypothetical protein